MKIIILGAGQVGRTLAENLIDDNHDITIVDINADLLHQLQDKLDLSIINGHGSYPKILKEAGAENADILVAVTNSDEINMIACQIAYSLFKTPNKVARIRATEYFEFEGTDKHKLFASKSNHISIDYIISPEQLVINYIYKLIQYPGTLQVIDFSNHKVSIIVTKAYYGSILIGNYISNIHQYLLNIHLDTRIVAIFRRNKYLIPQDTSIIETGDELFFVVATKQIRAVMKELHQLEKPYRRIMIVGGGNIGAGLAKQLEKIYSIKLIEKDPERATELAELLSDTIVFYGDASDQKLLAAEHIEQTDVFIALTNDDEANIMSAMLAKKMGAKKVIVLIQRSAYVDLIQDQIIDIAISPEQVTISALLGHIRKSDIINISSLRNGIAKAIEAVVHGNQNTSKVIGKTISEVKLPPSVIISAIVRGEEVIIDNTYNTIKPNDHIIMIITETKQICEVERIFQ